MPNNDIIVKIDTALNYIEKRNELIKKVNELSQYYNYLHTQQMDKSAFLAYNKIPSATALRIISNVLFPIGTIWFIFSLIAAYNASSNNMVVPILMIIAAAVMGTVSSSMRKNKYNQYLQQDNQYRSFCQSKVPEYQQAVQQLNQLEQYMNDTKNCIIPKEYWNNSLEISGYIKNGRANSVSEAIELLKSNRQIN